MKNVKEGVFKILSDLSGVSVNEAQMRLVEDIGLDSLMLVTMLIEIEEEFNIELNESDMNPYDFITAGDVIAMTERYVGDVNG
jgi:phosphopantetheine attachment domain protein